MCVDEFNAVTISFVFTFEMHLKTVKAKYNKLSITSLLI